MEDSYRMRWYRLNDKKEVVPCTIDELSDRDDRRVKQDVVGEYWVSTVFLTIDHAWNEPENPEKDYQPLIFETMIKNTVTGGWEDFQNRDYTWDEAVAGHDLVVERLKQGLPIDDAQDYE